MPANTAPLFPLVPRLEWVKLTTANTATDGTGTVGTCFTAQSNGSRCDRLRFRALGTNVATVARIFVNNGSTNATAGNNSLVAEVRLPATTASDVGEIGPEITAELNLSLPSGYEVNVVLGTAVSAGWQITGIGGDY